MISVNFGARKWPFSHCFLKLVYSHDEAGLLTLILRKFRLKGNAMPRAQVSDVKSMMMHPKQC